MKIEFQSLISPSPLSPPSRGGELKGCPSPPSPRRRLYPPAWKPLRAVCSPSRKPTGWKRSRRPPGEGKLDFLRNRQVFINKTWFFSNLVGEEGPRIQGLKLRFTTQSFPGPNFRSPHPKTDAKVQQIQPPYLFGLYD